MNKYERLELYVDENHPQLNDNIQYIHLKQLFTIENTSCLEIEVNNCLDYVLDRNEILSHIVHKLRYNGILHISGMDLNSISYNYYVGNMELSQMQALLYSGRLSASTRGEIIRQLQAKQLTITHDVINDNQYFITAQREMSND